MRLRADALGQVAHDHRRLHLDDLVALVVHDESRCRGRRRCGHRCSRARRRCWCRHWARSGCDPHGRLLAWRLVAPSARAQGWLRSGDRRGRRRRRRDFCRCGFGHFHRGPGRFSNSRRCRDGCDRNSRPLFQERQQAPGGCRWRSNWLNRSGRWSRRRRNVPVLLFNRFGGDLVHRARGSLYGIIHLVQLDDHFLARQAAALGQFVYANTHYVFCSPSAGCRRLCRFPSFLLRNRRLLHCRRLFRSQYVR